MIETLRVLNPDNTCVPWWNKVPWLQGKIEFTFKPGLNIVIGPNGSGKSTLIRALARLTFCEQGGTPLVSREGLGHFRGQYNEPPRVGLELVQDGQGTLFAAADTNNGLIGGGAGFDYDFMTQGIHNAMFKGSQGEGVIQRCLRTMTRAIQGEIPEVRYKVHRPKAQERQAIYDAQVASLQGTIPKGSPTLLLDEPTRSLAVTYQAGVWRRLGDLAETRQIIVATHCPFALFHARNEEVLWIETQPGYLPTLLRAYAKLGLEISQP